MKKSETTDPVQKELVSYSEDKLQKSVVEPLLRAMGFKDVRDRSGVNERGKDLTAIKEDALGKEYYAIQLKKTKLSGTVSSTDSLSFLLGQLRQAIVEPIVFPTEMEPRKPNRLIFITPFPMENSAVCSLEQSLIDIKSQGVTILDGIHLSDLVRKYLPEFLTGEEIYRRNTYNSSESLLEANVALQTHRSLTMQEIYVDVSVADNRNILNNLTNNDVILSTKNKLGAVSTRDYGLFDRLSKSSFNFSYEEISLVKLKKERKELIEKGLVWPRTKKELNEFEDYAIVSPNEIFSELVEAAKYCKRVLFSAKTIEGNQGDIREGFDRIHDLNEFILTVLKSPFLKRLWNDSIKNTREHSFRITSETLLYSQKPICIIGPAGAGKTTLLKHITQLAAQNKECEIPIFIPLLHLGNYSEKGIVEYISDELTKGGFIIEGRKGKYSVPKLMESGGVRVHFDGLDEAGNKSKDALLAIKEVHASYPNMPIILTSRHTININWDGLIRFSIEPFSKDKLVLFIGKWFNAEPSAKDELIKWIETHKRLQTVAQTPLIAALLCVLYSADVELPETEDELYSRRLELLLGQWDSAKGIARMPKKRREAYKLFLMTLAFDMHESNLREIAYSDAVTKSEPFYKEFRDSKSAMLVDCISRGLLFRNENGDISFGHLTYQEHLSAMYLAKHNPVIDILNKLEDPWWTKTLQFYAMQMTSIDQLIRQANKYSKFEGEKRRRLIDLIPYAPYTGIELS